MKKTLKPPSGLSPDAKRWWALIVSAYEISVEDPAGLLLLQTALESWDSMRACRREIIGELQGGGRPAHRVVDFTESLNGARQCRFHSPDGIASK
ncbi:MAG: hypothetical protein ABSC08_15785 [Bryobacteraceae bacterium]